MRLGLTLAPAASGVLEVVALAVAAERAGFHTIYVPERHFDAAFGFASPFAIAAAIAGQLQHAWVGVQPALGLEHPLRVVEQSNLVDVLTRGRSLIVLEDQADAASERQAAAFGRSVPRRDDLVERLSQAWAWQYQEDGPPLEIEFADGQFSTSMAGRIMPAPCRAPHPLLALATSSRTGVLAAARRGWGVQIHGPEAVNLVSAYVDALMRSGHPAVTIEDCLHWLVVTLRVTHADADLTPRIHSFERAGVAEVRLDPATGVSFEELPHVAA